MKTIEILKKYSQFRKNMNVPIDIDTAYKYWDKGGLSEIKDKNIEIGKIENSNLKIKMNIAKNFIKYLKILDWVKFLAVSGSVASGFAKEEDDIDIFAVVKNDRAWVYRGLILLRNIFHRKIRVGSSEKNVKDKLCLNFIAEERALKMNSDIFNLNEIISLKPVYNPDYFNTLISENRWLFTDFNISSEVLKKSESKGINIKNLIHRRYLLYSFFNFLFFLPQLFYMKLLKHNPDYRRLLSNYKIGKIEFFPKEFKDEKLRALK